MTHDLTIDRDRCMGSGQCTFYAPNTFDLDDLSIAVVTDQRGDSDDKVQMAINVCPTRSIARVDGGVKNEVAAGAGNEVDAGTKNEGAQ